MRIRGTPIAIGTALLLSSAFCPRSVSAQSRAGDVNLGLWANTCRIQRVGTDETVTFASDGTWAENACSSVLAAMSDTYIPYPINYPRPGELNCAFIYTYGGYWQVEHAPYGYYGAAQIAVRDDSGATGGIADCGSLTYELSTINGQNGFNDVNHPLAPIPIYTGPGYGGGGGGGAPTPVLNNLPKAPKVKHPSKKPKHYKTSDPSRCQASLLCGVV